MNLTPSAPAIDAVPRPAGAREWLGLAVLSLAVLVVAVDATVLDVAVPFLSEDLAPTSTELLWIIDAYPFVLAALLITMGVAGDRLGRRRLLLLGSAGFGGASLLAAFATDPGTLILARVLQGISGATLMPATLASIRSMFAEPRQRATAIGVWGAVWGGGAAAGPLLGGWLLEHFWWGSVFLVNVPIVVVLLVAVPLAVSESRDPRPGRFDPISVALSVMALLTLVYGLKETAVHGPRAPLVLIALVGVVAGWAFWRRQGRLATPMIDLGLFRVPAFAAAVTANALSMFALAGVLFFGSQFLQLVLGHRPLSAGLLMLPGTVATLAGSLLAAPLMHRVGVRRALGGPLVLAAVGAAAMVGLSAHGGAVLYVLAFALVGLGAGVALTLTSALVIEAVRPERAGAASAVSETAYEVGGAAGVAALGSVLMAVYRARLDTAGLDPDEARVARDTLGGVVTVARDADPGVAAALFDSAQHAFVLGSRMAAGATAVLLLLAAVLAMAMLRPADRD